MIARPVALLLLLAAPAAAGVRIEVTLPAADPGPATGRLMVGFAAGNRPPSFTDAGPPGDTLAARDVDAFATGSTVSLDTSHVVCPKPGELPAGEYTVRAVFVRNPDILLPNAPGNAHSAAVKVSVGTAETVVKLNLDQQYPDPHPADTATNKFLKVPSKLLSAFHGRPMVYQLAVVLPPEFEQQPDARFPLIVDIGGFGGRYTSARRTRPVPGFIRLVPDGAGPFGDPYQVNSANNGPYGDALVQEVIPFVEKAYRGISTGKARFTCGGSTGGWVSLALQVFYPDTFNGCWSQCPDGVDFRAFQLIDVYADANAYRNRFGFERPARRTLDGDTVYTIRHECRVESAIGRGGRWELGGQQWASWNAVYGPKGADGKPVPLWDADGVINRDVAKQWAKYDLRRVLESNWKELGPKLAGKLNVWVGDADDYFLNNGVWRLKAAVDKFQSPKSDARILIEPRKGHSSGGWTAAEMYEAMAERAK